MSDNICRIEWRKRGDTGIVDICAVSPDDITLYKEAYGTCFHPQSADEAYRKVYDWTRENNYTISQEGAKS